MYWVVILYALQAWYVEVGVLWCIVYAKALSGWGSCNVAMVLIGAGVSTRFSSFWVDNPDIMSHKSVSMMSSFSGGVWCSVVVSLSALSCKLL